MLMHARKEASCTAAVAKVFIIEDDSSMCRSLARLVRAAGWDAETYATPSAFLERAAFDGKGCALIDVRLPGMTGLELHEVMLERGMSLPVVFLTGHDQVAAGVHAIKSGAVDYLLKPIDAETLLAAICAALERHGTQQARSRENERARECLKRLSPRELEVMHYVVDGLLNKQIASTLDISLKTVKKHRARVMEKMEAGSIVALVRACEAAGVGCAHAD